MYTHSFFFPINTATVQAVCCLLQGIEEIVDRDILKGGVNITGFNMIKYRSLAVRNLTATLLKDSPESSWKMSVCKVAVR